MINTLRKIAKELVACAVMSSIVTVIFALFGVATGFFGFLFLCGVIFVVRFANK